MMRTFQDIDLQYGYFGKGKHILDAFLLPVLEVATKYDRVTSFYTIDSLLAISHGIDSLYSHGGHMRLIIGIHSFPPELADAVLRRTYIQEQIAQVRDAITEGLSSISDSLTRKRLATLAWMIEDGLLEVKAASIKGGDLFHPKTLILTDAANNRIAAVGSPNETDSGLGGNYEQLMVATSWTIEEAVDFQEQFFNSLWNNDADDAVVVDMTEDLAQTLKQTVCRGLAKPTKKSGAHVRLIESAAQMPAHFFVSGTIPALYQHQERAVIDALSRWPVRVLFADEVGLGKTFEAAATMVFLIKYCGVKRTVILTPKAVLQQWQDELWEHFHLNAWRYDSSARSYIDPFDTTVYMGDRNPIGTGSPDLMLMSSQFARGGGGKPSVFDRDGAVLPDLLMVDEAHAARVSTDISGSTKATMLYRALESVSSRIPHLILATATPMQKDAEEYHAILKLLGLPKIWNRVRNYKTSLSVLTQEDIPSFDEAFTVGRLLSETASAMQPAMTYLTSDEGEALRRLVSISINGDSFDLADYVQTTWHSLRGAFVKLHPAHLLTVRNTRRSLEEVGYVFPRRELHEIAVSSSSQLRLFYMKVNDYLSNQCFAVERALYPERKFNVGFVRASYQQRLASSLSSCKKSLRRRFEKLMSLREALSKLGAFTPLDLSNFGVDSELDAIEQDDLLSFGTDYADAFKENPEIDLEKLANAVELEITSIPSLIANADRLLKAEGDTKINQSVNLAKECLLNGDKVLLFSRYTDTIDALIERYISDHSSTPKRYGIYTGQKSVIVDDSGEHPCTKKEIKTELSSGRLSLMFCSDAASEGLNLQAARVLINVDVPWTPARLEQRIGRIARLGQTARVVDVYNVWYPDSVEARMYRRIQKRLEQLNLAIGEFPEVVADDIRNLVMEDREQEDESLATLQEIRNSIQTKALEELWSQQDGLVTESSRIRRALIEVCDEAFPRTSSLVEDGINEYQMPSGECVSLSAREGLQESVSLTGVPWSFTDIETDVYGLINDQMGNPATFVFNGDSSSWISPHALAPMLKEEPIAASEVTDSYPKMLANPTSLTLSFAVDVALPKRPSFWPPVA